MSRSPVFLLSSLVRDDSPRLKPASFTVSTGGASRFIAVACSPSAPRRLRPSPKNLGLTDQRPLQDVLRRIDIPVVSHPTIRALPGAIGQR